VEVDRRERGTPIRICDVELVSFDAVDLGEGIERDLTATLPEIPRRKRD
jgi:hypothetical protein